MSGNSKYDRERANKIKMRGQLDDLSRPQTKKEKVQFFENAIKNAEAQLATAKDDKKRNKLHEIIENSKSALSRCK